MVRRFSKSIPQGWNDYSPIKDIIDDIKIVAFKVPLPLTRFQRPNKSGSKWTPADVMEHVPDLGLVIDLTYKFPCYYDVIQFLENGVGHVKIGCEGHVVPQDERFVEFCDTIEAFHEEHPDQIVGVHCTHGVNRTGYMICRYMVEKHGYTAERAFETFFQTRGYPIERDNYKQHIYELARR